MSSTTSTASIASQPPVAYTPPVRNEQSQQDAKTAEKNAQKGAELTQTAVAAQAAKESGKGRVVDITV
ncbi:hypothetical protein [Phenylobacterium sp.]|uniref:hypothetical protein n=1 Tax=Phenylobacterium sp. TaxID=1871053 RepID=UPI0025D5ADCF|nr:hypothetical protein [Phenylobacterium sp.]